MGKLPKAECSARFKIAQKAGKSHGGQLLAMKYAGVDAKYKWRCSSGHEWVATYDCVVRRGHWCGKCSGRTPDRNKQHKEAIKIAKQRRGECVSGEYVNSKVNMRWRCAEGHAWKASFSNISRGKWCPYCAGNTVDARERLECAKKYALDQGGECLTNTYGGNKTPMRWRCASGHEWHAAYNTVVNRRAWCARCRGTDRDAVEQLERAKNMALSKGGRCLSDIYTNNSSSLRWRCRRGHEWEAAFYSVVQAGSWCPNCSAGLNERLARHALEQLFEQPFKKARPKWLVNPETGRQMELDGFNEQIGLAFEYQGEHHYRTVKPFKMDTRALIKRQRMDQVKKMLCAKHEIHLLEIPHHIDPNDMPRWITERVSLQPSGASLRGKMKDWRNIQPEEWLESDSYSIDDLRRRAESRGGSCLSNTYKGVLTKHEWQCQYKHKWAATWDSVNRGSWCPCCSGNVIDSQQRLKWAKSIAKKNGGECLSTRYERVHAKMRWRCASGHEWESRYDHVVQGGSWCPKCREPRRYKK